MNFSDLNQSLQQAKDKNELKKHLIDYFSSFGIKSVAFTYYKNHTKSGNKLVYDWVTNPLLAWHRYYLDSQFADVDRTLETSRQQILPVFWDVQQQLAQAKNNRERKIRKESMAFGIDKGLSLSLHGPHSDFVVLVLHQRIGEQGLSLWEQLQFEWMVVLQCYFHHLVIILGDDRGQDSQLTRREKQCLQLTAEGFRVEAIAKRLNITSRTVNFHLQNANKKLGTHNKYFSIVKMKM